MGKRKKLVKDTISVHKNCDHGMHWRVVSTCAVLAKPFHIPEYLILIARDSRKVF